jgi:hypothetical protein
LRAGREAPAGRRAAARERPAARISPRLAAGGHEEAALQPLDKLGHTALLRVVRVLRLVVVQSAAAGGERRERGSSVQRGRRRVQRRRGAAAAEEANRGQRAAGRTFCWPPSGGAPGCCSQRARRTKSYRSVRNVRPPCPAARAPAQTSACLTAPSPNPALLVPFLGGGGGGRAGCPHTFSGASGGAQQRGARLM